MYTGAGTISERRPANVKQSPMKNFGAPDNWDAYYMLWSQRRHKRRDQDIQIVAQRGLNGS